MGPGDLGGADGMDTDDDSGSMAVAAPPGREGVGALLRARRLELGLTHADVGALVKLSGRRIVAMEEERWEELPEGTFLRGFLRNLARALQLDPAVLVERVDETRVRSRNPDSILVAPVSTHTTLPRRSGPMEARHNGRALIYAAFLFALLAAVIAWSGTASFDRVLEGGKAMIAARSGGAKADASPQKADDGATTLPSAGADASVAPESPSPTVAAASQDVAAPVRPDPSIGSVAATAASPATPTSEDALSFHFDEPSWVEVRAANGKVLLQQTNDAGSDRELSGEAPFTLIVGNVKGVSLQFRGKPVDLAPFTKGAVARLTLPLPAP
jgi:cytoskeleton protein RodZ